MSAKSEAHALVDAFGQGAGGGLWINIKRKDLATGLHPRIDNPDLINQADTNLCGPAEFVRNIVIDRPKEYVKCLSDLFLAGQGRLGTLVIKPRKALLDYKLPATAVDEDSQPIEPVDWVILASIRDSDNWYFKYSSKSDAASAMTLPHSKVAWLKQAGYREVWEDTDLVSCKDLRNARIASTLHKDGYKVALLINANMLKPSTMNDASVFPDHWIALTSTIFINDIQPEGVSMVAFKAYSWGRQWIVPSKDRLTVKHFLWNYYGYIACRR